MKIIGGPRRVSKALGLQKILFPLQNQVLCGSMLSKGVRDDAGIFKLDSAESHYYNFKGDRMSHDTMVRQRTGFTA